MPSLKGSACMKNLLTYITEIFERLITLKIPYVTECVFINYDYLFISRCSRFIPYVIEYCTTCT